MSFDASHAMRPWYCSCLRNCTQTSRVSAPMSAVARIATAQSNQEQSGDDDRGHANARIEGKQRLHDTVDDRGDAVGGTGDEARGVLPGKLLEVPVQIPAQYLALQLHAQASGKAEPTATATRP